MLCIYNHVHYKFPFIVDSNVVRDIEHSATLVNTVIWRNGVWYNIKEELHSSGNGARGTMK